MSVDKIREYSRRLDKHSEDKNVLKDTLYKLNKLEVTVDILQKTGIGKIVNSIKNRGGKTGDMAADLIKKWRHVVDREAEQEDVKPIAPKLSEKSSEQSSEKSSDSRKKAKVKENHHHHHHHHHQKHKNEESASHHNGHSDKKSSSSKSSSKKNDDHHHHDHNHHQKQSQPEKQNSEVKVEQQSPDKTGQKDRKRKKTTEEDELDAQFGSFADCLGFGDPVNMKKKKKSKSSSPKMTVTTSTLNGSSSKPKGPRLPDLNDKKLPDSQDLGIAQLVSEYKPLPRLEPKAQSSSSKKPVVYDEAAMFTSNKRDRTAVYSGRRTAVTLTSVPTLFDACVRVLIANVDYIEDTGGVPFEILKPIMERCTSDQLLNLEYHNPYLLEDSDSLWEYHTRKKFRGQEPIRGEETWREVFLRSQDEVEQKLKSVRASINQSQRKQVPVRTTKLAYVDSMAKPPRGVAKAQLKHGTHLANKAQPSQARRIASQASTSTAVESVRAPSTANRKPKMAPLMAKTMSFLKMRKSTGYGFASR